MIGIDHNRRAHERIDLSRRCKVFEPRGRRYVSGTTCNVSTGGLLLRLDRALPVEAGDRVYVGIADRRQALLKSDSMEPVEVVRAFRLTTGEMALAVSFLEPATLPFPFARAA